jgi:hypothetical protein
MDESTALVAVEISRIVALYISRETDEAIQEHIRSLYSETPRLYRPTVDYQHHQFRLSDLSDAKVREFTG